MSGFQPERDSVPMVSPMLTAGCLSLFCSVALCAPEGLLLHYPMTEGQGEALTDAVAGRAARLTAAAWASNGMRSAVRFNGRDSVTALTDLRGLSLGSAFSVDLWYNTALSREPVGLVTWAGSFRLLLYPRTGKLLVDINGEKGRIYEAPEGPVKRGAWQHVCLTYQAGAPDAPQPHGRDARATGATLCLDGEPIFRADTDIGRVATGSGPLRIGLGVDPRDRRYFKGLLAGVRLWGKALSQEEIRAMIQQDKPALQGTFRGGDDLAPKLPPAAAIDVGSRRQLFIDERFIEAARDIRLRMNPPTKLGVVLKPLRAWEDKSFGFCASVLEDEGILKLFYETWSTRGTFVCLATSTDGVHWERANVGLVEFAGSKDNNIVYQADGEATVFLDPHGKPEERYKMIEVRGWPDPHSSGLFCNTSPDGLRWTRGPRVLPLVPDTANQAAWDAQRGKYVAYIRLWDPLRKYGRVEMDDILQPWPFTDLGENAFFIWGRDKVPVPSREIPTAFGYDDQDPAESDHYNPAVFEYPWAEAAYFSFPSAYQHFPEPPVGKYGNDGLLDIQMAVSRDGVQFHRVERGPYVPLGLAGEPDSLSNYMAIGVVRRGDYLYQLYGAYDVTHGLPESEQKLPIGGFCAVRQRLDGFVSADAPWQGGEFITPPITFSGRRLVLNLDASAMGVCQVGLLDAEGNAIPGFEAELCDELRGNSVAMTVSWEAKADVSPLAGKPVRLRFVMRAAKLFAFQFLD